MDRLEELLAESRKRKAASDKYYRLANERREQLRDREWRRHEYRAEHGNEASAAIIRSKSHFEAILNSVCTSDTVWKSHVEDQKFNERLANQAAHQAMMEATAGSTSD